MSDLFDRVTYRKVESEDAKSIQDLANTIWPVSFSNILSNEQINYMMEMMYAIPVLEKEIGRGVSYYIFSLDKNDIGYTAIEPKESGVFKLHKIYLAPNLQGKGLGKFQLATMEKTVIALGGKSLYLNVNRSNKAVSFYQSQGYEIIREEDIDIGKGYFMNDFVMQKKL